LEKHFVHDDGDELFAELLQLLPVVSLCLLFGVAQYYGFEVFARTDDRLWGELDGIAFFA
jgi:hypothetical protein